MLTINKIGLNRNVMDYFIILILYLLTNFQASVRVVEFSRIVVVVVAV